MIALAPMLASLLALSLSNLAQPAAPLELDRLIAALDPEKPIEVPEVSDDLRFLTTRAQRISAPLRLERRGEPEVGHQRQREGAGAS